MRKSLALLFALPLAAAALYGALPSGLSTPAEATTPTPQLTIPSNATQESAVFAGGCFWGVEGVFEHVKGVKRATSGYAGGTASTAKYAIVSSGRTDHAEAVRVDFDPRVVSYAQLLQVYFSVVADPTTLNYQGPDHGRHYRTALFPTNAAQVKIARAYFAQLSAARSFKRPIVTKLESGTFYAAENYHQDYLSKHPNQPYIVINDRPKVEALRKQFSALYRG